MDNRLYFILKPYDNWWDNQKGEGEEKNLQARKALYDFYLELKKYKPCRVYARRDILHMTYFPYLVRIKKALKERKYQRACNELVSLMHYEPFFQGRIYFNVLKLLETEVAQYYA
jgi:hypothetical protein